MRISDWSSDVCSSDLNSIAALLISVSAFAASPALAGSISFKPLIDTRMRYENVDQDGILEKADALTIRARAGFELGLSKDFSFLVEGEGRSEEHTSELQSLMRISYAVFCFKKKTNVFAP